MVITARCRNLGQTGRQTSCNFYIIIIVMGYTSKQIPSFAVRGGGFQRSSVFVFEGDLDIGNAGLAYIHNAVAVAVHPYPVTDIGGFGLRDNHSVNYRCLSRDYDF